MLMLNRMPQSTLVAKVILLAIIISSGIPLEAVQSEVKQDQTARPQGVAQSGSTRSASHLKFPLPETVPQPVHVLRLHGPQSALPLPAFPAAGSFATYFGGAVISNVHVVQVLYGTGSFVPEVQATATPSVASFFADITQSSYFDMLAEYNTAGVTAADGAPGTSQTIGHGFFDGQFTITPSAANNGTTITDTQIQSELLAQVTAGHLPAPVIDAQGNNSSLYMLYFPAGKTILLQNTPSCQSGGFCAYHSTTTGQFGGRNLFYGVMPDVQPPSLCSQGCGGGSLFNIVTNVTSHELAEAVTDANVGLANNFARPLAWFDPLNGEIADMCLGQEVDILANGTTYRVQREFSNLVNDCVAGPMQLLMTAVPAVSSGTEFDIDMAADSTPPGTVLFRYNGTVHFSSSDPAAVLPADYTFTFADQGQHHFLATLKTSGPQTITASDANIKNSSTTISVNVNAPNVSQFSLAFPGAATTGAPVNAVVRALDPSFVLQTNYTGKVHFTSSDPGAVLPPDTNLVSGTGSFSVTFNTAGTQSLQVADAATPSIFKSNTAVVTAGGANATTTTLTPTTPTTVVFGQSVQFNVNVSSSTPITQPGSFTFSVDGGAVSGGGIINSTIEFFSPIGGTHTVYANYLGDGVHLPSSSAPITVTATPAPSTMSLRSSSLSAAFGTLITLSAFVTPAGAFPRGTVTFFDGASPIAILPAASSDAPGLALSALPVGTHSMTAAFSDSPDFQPATSNAITQVITPPPAPNYAANAVPNVQRIRAGQSAVFDISVVSLNGFKGDVSFSCGALPPLVTCTLVPAHVTVGGTLSVASAAVIIKTSGPNAKLLPPVSPQNGQRLNAAAWGAGLFAVGLVLVSLGSKKTRRGAVHGLSALLLVVAIISCGGGGGSTPPPPPAPTPAPATPAGTYAITVSSTGTATSGSAPSNPNQQVQLNLTVQP
jgi:Big-like domain-containing protein